MKKILSVLLVLVMAFSIVATLSACGDNDATNTEQQNNDLALQTKYDNAIKDLNAYIENRTYTYGYTYGNLENNSITEARLYKEFKELGDYKDSAKYLEKFTVHPNMLVKITKTRIDNLGNKYTTEKRCQYDPKGSIIDYISLMDSFGHYGTGYALVKYDKTGTPIHISNHDPFDDTTVIITPSYDENGNMTEASILTHDSTFTYKYVYDDQNRLISSERHMGLDSADHRLIKSTYHYNEGGLLEKETHDLIESYSERVQEKSEVVEYLYDENGRVILKKRTNPILYGINEYTSTYEYDANGNLIKFTEPNLEETYTYELDESGNPISAELITTSDEKSTRSTLSYHYETLYFYIDAE